MKEEKRSFPDKKKLKELVNTKPVQQQMLKGLLGRGGRGGRGGGEGKGRVGEEKEKEKNQRKIV